MIVFRVDANEMRQYSTPTIQVKPPNLSTPQISNVFQFWSLIIFGVPSLICSLLIFYHYLSKPIRRHAIQNHTILILILTNVLLILTDFSWKLDSLRRPGQILFKNPVFCMIWWFLDYTLYNTQTIILAWASIERHILIFHYHIIATKKRQFYYHYLPPFILIVYLLFFYLIVIFFPPCINKFDYTSIECGFNPCYLKFSFLAAWDSIIHCVLPTILIAVFSLALLYRIIEHKKRIQQPIQWKKHRRMSMQILSLSAVYLFLNFPLTIIMLVQYFQEQQPQFGFGTQLYLFFLTYSVTLSLPFVVYLTYLSNEKNQTQRIIPTLTHSQHQRMYMGNPVMNN